MASDPNVYLVKGSDPVLVAAEVTNIVQRYTAADNALIAEDYSSAETPIEQIIDACVTPPFFSSKRLVVVRDIGALGGRSSASDEDDSGDAPSPTGGSPVDQLVAYIANPLDSTVLVLASGDGRLSPKFSTAVKKVGQVIETDAPRSGKQRSAWFDEQIAEAGVSLHPGAARAIGDRVGEDAGLLIGLLDRLSAVYGTGRRLDIEDVEPYLGEEGGVPPWELTDAIDRGDADVAVRAAQRMMHERHPLVLMATLQGHYEKLLALCDYDNSQPLPESLAKVPSFKLTSLRNAASDLGYGGLRRSFELLHQADVELKGGGDNAVPSIEVDGVRGALVIELLVARLSKLHRSKSGKRATSLARR